MILENSIARHGYVMLLVADYHKEYPFKTDWPKYHPRVQLVWDSFAISEVVRKLKGEVGSYAISHNAAHERVEEVEKELFGSLEKKYPGHYEQGMSLWTIQGSPNDITKVFDDHAATCSKGPSGDDDTYDYWPNALDMLIEIAVDLTTLTHNPIYANMIEAVLKSAEEDCGPLEDWEAEVYRNAPRTIRAIYQED